MIDKIKPKKRKYNSITREFVDQDYRKKLNKEEKAWLDAFNDEYYNGIYNEGDREIHPEHYDDELKSSRSARRKDLYGRLYGERGGQDSLELEQIDSNCSFNKVDPDEKLLKIDVDAAMKIVIEEAADLIDSKLVDTRMEIAKAIERGIRLFVNERKNK